MEPDLTDLLENTPEPKHYPRVIWRSGYEIKLDRYSGKIHGQLTQPQNYVIQGKPRVVRVTHAVIDTTEELVIDRLLVIAFRDRDRVIVETTKQDWIQDPANSI